ncbi:5'-cGMP phosphodiesterase A (Cyclic GMP-binding protein A) (Phosphodiesterase 5) (DdPDE5) (Phosphodiesterase D) [Durusdinium trenchii]|uniref:5'-cGMP phosphodiesterase A (Cyclic GMP-binding protein A) (Phosphodiesterase 5) (DdPDE5) (Phosphodiesterase D) n=1 Tax=Durusdinium trenchii TaxID=1381693 RepID=A0ABP0RJ95_9DINO
MGAGASTPEALGTGAAATATTTADKYVAKDGGEDEQGGIVGKSSAPSLGPAAGSALEEPQGVATTIPKGEPAVAKQEQKATEESSQVEPSESGSLKVRAKVTAVDTSRSNDMKSPARSATATSALVNDKMVHRGSQIDSVASSLLASCSDMDEASARYIRALPRGGHWCKLGDTTLQFGCPPETIKDSMELGLDVPRYFVVLGELFSRKIGINFAELEFPAYFNFFIRKQKTVVLTTKPIEERVRALFQETLLGPQDKHLFLEEDHAEDTPRDCWPDFKAEGEWLDAARKTLTVDSLLEFRHFTPHGEMQDAKYCDTYSVQVDDIEIMFHQNEKCYRITSSSHLPEETELRVSMAEIIRKFEEEGPKEPKPTPAEAPTPDDPRPVEELPVFGITMLGTSHGFDPKGQTTGFVLWANRRGTMVDPPPNAIDCLKELGISARMIDSIVLTHCHSDHDAGTFRRLLFDQQITMYTTRTIFESFLRKYSAITGFSQAFLSQLLVANHVRIGDDHFIHGAKWNFFYSLHTIPCIGFKVVLDNQSIVYSADTHNFPELFDRMYADKILGDGRMRSLSSFPWDASLILHEAGVPPIHTPMSVLLALPDDIKKKLYVVHVAAKDVPEEGGLRTLKSGETKVLPAANNDMETAIEILDVLSTVDLFSEACQTFRDALATMYLIQTESFEPGELIVRQGEPGDKFYIITKGTALVKWVQNNVCSKKRFYVGDYFGETSLVTGEPRNADVYAMGHVRTASMSRQHFEYLIRGTDVKQDLLTLANIRQKDSWHLISKNPLSRKLTSTAKTHLEFLMEERKFEKGEVAWNVGEPAACVMLVQSGSFHVKGDERMLRDRKINLSVAIDSESGTMQIMSAPLRRSASSVASTLSNGGNYQSGKLVRVAVQRECSEEDSALGTCGVDEVATKGSFIADFDAILSELPVVTTVVALEEGSAFIITQAKWKQFCAKYPAGLLQFMGHFKV